MSEEDVVFRRLFSDDALRTYLAKLFMTDVSARYALMYTVYPPEEHERILRLDLQGPPHQVVVFLIRAMSILGDAMVNTMIATIMAQPLPPGIPA